MKKNITLTLLLILPLLGISQTITYTGMVKIGLYALPNHPVTIIDSSSSTGAFNYHNTVTNSQGLYSYTITNPVGSVSIRTQDTCGQNRIFHRYGSISGLTTITINAQLSPCGAYHYAAGVIIKFPNTTYQFIKNHPVTVIDSSITGYIRTTNIMSDSTGYYHYATNSPPGSRVTFIALDTCGGNPQDTTITIGPDRAPYLRIYPCNLPPTTISGTVYLDNVPFPNRWVYIHDTLSSPATLDSVLADAQANYTYTYAGSSALLQVYAYDTCYVPITYTVALNGSNVTQSIFLNGCYIPTSIKYLDDSPISIYPNPTSGKDVIVEGLGEFGKNCTIMVSNAYGQVVEKIENIQTKTYSIRTQGWSSGMYLVSVINSDGEVSMTKLDVR